MAVSFKTALGTGASVTSGTTLTITTTAAIAVDDLVVVRVAADNLSATTPTITCGDGSANVYTSHAFRGQNATGGGGVVGAIFACKATATRATSSTITLTFSGAITAKAAQAQSFTGVDNTTRSTPVLNSAATGNATVTSGTVNGGDLVLGCAVIESRAAVTGDSDTLNGSWSTAVTTLAAASGTDALRVEVSGQYKIPNAAGAQTYNVTNTSVDWAAMIVVLQATPSTITGTAVASVPISVTGTGTVIKPGTASASLGLTVVATGTSFKLVTGTAAVTLPIAVTATGTVIKGGTAQVNVAVAATATGTSFVPAEIITGTASASIAVAVTVTGTVDAARTVTDPLGATDPKTWDQTTEYVLGLTDSVTSTLTTHGTAQVDLGFTATATGTRFGVVTGTASVPLGIAVTATGGRIVNGTASTALAVNVAASGVPFGVKTGTAQTSLSLSITATGTTAGGQTITDALGVTDLKTWDQMAEYQLGLTDSITSTLVKPGTAQVSVGVAVTATGTSFVPTQTVTGTASVGFAVAVTATGSRVVAGTAQAPLAVGVTATGTVIKQGAATVQLGVTATATGQVAVAEIVSGLAQVAVGVTVQAAGTRITSGTARADLVVTVLAAGTVIMPGDVTAVVITCAWVEQALASFTQDVAEPAVVVYAWVEQATASVTDVVVPEGIPSLLLLESGEALLLEPGDLWLMEEEVVQVAADPPVVVCPWVERATASFMEVVDYDSILA